MCSMQAQCYNFYVPILSLVVKCLLVSLVLAPPRPSLLPLLFVPPLPQWSPGLQPLLPPDCLAHWKEVPLILLGRRKAKRKGREKGKEEEEEEEEDKEEEEEIEEQRSTKSGRKEKKEERERKKSCARSHSSIFTIVSIIHTKYSQFLHTINNGCFNHRHGVITSCCCLGKWS